MRGRLHSQFHRNPVYFNSSRLGAVYKAERLSDGAIVAVKEISLRNIPQDQYIILCRPYELSRNISHPHILEYYEAYITPGERCLLEMEFCENGSLLDTLDYLYQRQEYMEESFIWEIIAQINDALLYLHEQNKEQGKIIHRSVKVSSIFIGADGLKLGKLGLTRHASELTVFGTRPKQTMYTPPEATSRKTPTEKWDIWGLGCLAVELCTLGTVYSDTSIMLKHLSQDMRRYSDALGIMVASCLSISEADRPTAAEIKNHIEVRRAIRRMTPSSVTKVCIKKLRDAAESNAKDANEHVATLNNEDEEHVRRDEKNSEVLTVSSKDLALAAEMKTENCDTGQTTSSNFRLAGKPNSLSLYNGLISDDLMELIMDDNVHGVMARANELVSCLKTVLDVALFESRSNVLKFICKFIYMNNLKIQAPKRRGKTAQYKTTLMSAVEVGSIERVWQNLDQIMQVFPIAVPVKNSAKETSVKEEVTALMLAASANNVDLVKLLLPELGIQNNNGMTALMFAAQNNSANALKYLVAEAGIRTSEGKTALMFAVYNNSMECAQILNERERHICDKVGKTAADYISAMGSSVPIYYQSAFMKVLGLNE